MVARALLLRPRLIIADEPVSMVDASLRATILDSLRRLNQDFGISVIYITHDLTTAYQIGDNIVVMYRGAAVEAGDVEHVVKQPLHPYSQLLVASIPLPDPQHTWEHDAIPVDAADIVEIGPSSCRFADRCPHVMARCHASLPPLFQTDPRRAAACYLYDSAPILKSQDLGQVLTAPASVTPESV
jgi:peptide/nickel transport system ATP-binding protein